MFTTTMNFKSRSTHSDGKYQKPENIRFEEMFVIKVQAIDDLSPIMVYDETRYCSFIISPGQIGFKEVLTEIRNEKAWLGCKTFMKASFDNNGDCTVYPNTAGVKARYNW